MSDDLAATLPPVLLPTNQFPHFYRGGDRIGALRGGPGGPMRPEEWIGSTVTRFGEELSGLSELPDGRLLVLNRWFGPPFRFANVLVLIDPRAIRPGAVVRGREIARLVAPLTHDNVEGVAATVEGGRTIVWLVSDDNHSRWERTLLLKFRLD